MLISWSYSQEQDECHKVIPKLHDAIEFLRVVRHGNGITMQECSLRMFKTTTT